MYDRNQQTHIDHLQAMEDACGDIAVDAFHGWIHHASRYFPRNCKPSVVMLWFVCSNDMEPR